MEVLDELVLYRRYHGGNFVASKQVNGPLPLLSLKAKLDRDRAQATEAAAAEAKLRGMLQVGARVPRHGQE